MSCRAHNQYRQNIDDYDSSMEQNDLSDDDNQAVVEPRRRQPTQRRSENARIESLVLDVANKVQMVVTKNQELMQQSLEDKKRSECLI